MDDRPEPVIRQSDFIRAIPTVARLVFAALLFYLFPAMATLSIFAFAIIVWHFVSDLKRDRLPASRFFGPLLFAGGFFVVCLVVDGVARIKEREAEDTRSSTNLKQIGLAFHRYKEAHGSLPPAAIHGIDGKPLLSWRVALLPYMENDVLYTQFHLDEPWDGPHNRLLLNSAPETYQPIPRCQVAIDPTTTCYQVFVGPRAAFEGISGLRIPADFPGGLKKTILVVETRSAVPWTKPVDLPFGEDQPIPELGVLQCRSIGRLDLGRDAPRCFFAALADCSSVDRIPVATAPEKLRLWIDRTSVDKPSLEEPGS